MTLAPIFVYKKELQTLKLQKDSLDISLAQSLEELEDKKKMLFFWWRNFNKYKKFALGKAFGKFRNALSTIKKYEQINVNN